MTRLDLAAAILFGSAARGRAGTQSDLDLALLPVSHLDPALLAEAAIDLEAELGRHVDLVDLSRASPVLGHQVLAHGRVLHVANRRRLGAFIARTLSDYEELKATRAPIEARILQKARNGR